MREDRSRPRSRAPFVCVAAFAALTSAEPTAQANGRFPNANELLIHPSDPKTVVIRATFGLITTRDGGKTFYWTCEPIIGFDQGLDPGVAIFGDGSIASGSTHGLAVTHDQSCSFPFVSELANQYVIDLALEKTTSNAVALTATPISGDTSYVQVFQTADNGQTWTKAGAQLGTDVIATTIEVAPSRPQRLYVAGSYIANGLRNAFVQASDDRGLTWGARTVIEGTTTLYLAAVDPFDADRVYVRTLRPALHDSVLVSTDGAKTFDTAITVQEQVTAFALSPDGSKIAAGGPVDGIYVGSRVDAGAAYQFVQKNTIPVDCLRWSADALYACGVLDQRAPFAVGMSTDEGATFTPLLSKLTDIAGPEPNCAPGTPAAVQCPSLWPAQLARFTNPNGPLPDAATAPPDSGSSPVGPPTPAAPKDDSGCQSVDGRGSGDGLGPRSTLGLTAVGAIVGLALLRRRRRGL